MRGGVKVYINGEEQFVGSDFPDLFTGSNAEFGLGVNYWDTPFKGLMDELSIYNYALTSEEVQSLARLYVKSEDLIKADKELEIEEQQEQSEIETEIVEELETTEEVAKEQKPIEDEVKSEPEITEEEVVEEQEIMTEIETIEEVKKVLEGSQESDSIPE